MQSFFAERTAQAVDIRPKIKQAIGFQRPAVDGGALPERPYPCHRGMHRRSAKCRAGVFAYSRRDSRALGEVTQLLACNERERQQGGDRVYEYFLRTECVTRVHDMRIQGLMPDVLHGLGIQKIYRLVRTSTSMSMSNDKYDAIAAGHLAHDSAPTGDDLSLLQGRALE